MTRAALPALILATALAAAPGIPARAETTAPAAAPSAQTPKPATLVADSVRVEGRGNLVAEGHVVVFYEGTRMTATKVAYDKAGDRLTITGPIRLTQPDGTILTADSADLSADLTNGILTSARLVLDQQLQLAAAQIDRVGGRYTQLTKTVASSCEVCAAHPTPLWEIRASRVIHDQQMHQLYFDNATFRLAGVPIFYLPRLRMPDPTLKRATGFMLPKFRNTSLLGMGIAVPYFIAMGSHRDLTLTPYIATRTRTLNLRYRQAFANGRIEANGAITSDRVLNGQTRGYLFANGEFALKNDYRLRFDLQTVSDPAYLLDYGLSNTDRLQSDIELSRTRRNDYTSLRGYGFRSIRAGEINSTLPSIVAGYSRVHRFHPGLIGGQGTLTFDSFGLVRSSNLDVLGRDMARATIRLDWRRNWVVGPGIVVSAIGRATSDIYAIGQDSNWPGTVARTIPEAAVELRWPFVKHESGGGTQVLEPIVQLIASPRHVASVPNEDSTVLEFDQGNLWSLDRYPGYDALEYGPRANVGVRWTRIAPSGWTLGVVAGRVFRADSAQTFSTGSGLGGSRSDWLTAVRLSTPKGLSLTGRAVFDDNLSMTKSEARLGWQRSNLQLSTSYVWLVADPAENRTDDTSEWALDATWKVNDHWTGTVNWRYDFQAERATNAGLGFTWRNECMAVDLSLSRRFTSSTSVSATTSFGLSVDLIGISGRATGGTRRSCGG